MTHDVVDGKPQENWNDGNRRKDTLYHTTLKPRYNDPFYNKILSIKNLISSPSVVNLIVQIPCNNKIPAIKNKTFGLFRFVIPSFFCIINVTIIIQHVQPSSKQFQSDP